MAKKNFALIIYIILITTIHNYVKCAGMVEVFRWRQIDFYNRGDNAREGQPTRHNGNIMNKGSIIFPDQFNRRQKRDEVKTTSRDDPITVKNRFSSSSSSTNSSYIPTNNVPMGATHYNGRLFITVPRRRVGIPSTLNYIDLRRDGHNESPKLYAYPDFETNFIDPNNLVANTNRLISVYRTTVDACKRLWFIDTGMLEYPNNRVQVQRPTIWIMDLSTDRVIRRFPIPETIVKTGRGLASISIDVNSRNCDGAYAYLPDLRYNLLQVYSFEKNRIWSFGHNYFHFDPIAGDLNIAGQRFRWDDGIFSTTIGARRQSGYSPVYFHPMASNNEFVVANEVLQNEPNAARSDHGQDFRLLGRRGDRRQSTMHEYDPQTGVIFYNEIQRNGVGCWNTRKSFSEQNHGTVMQDEQNMIYPSDLTIDEQSNIWVMANSLPIFLYSKLDENTFNFHVWKQNAREAIKGTVCS